MEFLHSHSWTFLPAFMILESELACRCMRFEKPGYYMRVPTSHLLFLPPVAGQERGENHPCGPIPSFSEADCVPDGTGTFLAAQWLNKSSLSA